VSRRRTRSIECTTVTRSDAVIRYVSQAPPVYPIYPPHCCKISILCYSAMFMSRALPMRNAMSIEPHAMHRHCFISFPAPSPPQEADMWYRKPSPFLIKPTNSPNYLSSSFFNRSVDCWNSLSQTLKEVNSLGTFKKNLFMIDLSSFSIGSAFVIHLLFS
jgi:hypothetical protein